MMKKTGFILLLLLASSTSQGRDFEGSYATYGAGAKPCSIYLRAIERGGPEEDYFIDWTIGYLSAFNLIMPDTYDILGESEFTRTQLWLEQRCQKFPRELFINAVAKMTQVLYPTRYQSGLKESPAAENSPAADNPLPAKPPRQLKDIKIQ